MTKLNTPGGRSASAMHSASSARADRGARRRRPHDRVAARERRGDDLGRHRVRPVPRRDDRDRAERAADEQDALARVHARRDRALEADAVLGRAAPHRDELVDLVVGLGVQRLALVEGERAGELVAAALADVGDAAQAPRRARTRSPAPRPGTRPWRRRSRGGRPRGRPGRRGRAARRSPGWRPRRWPRRARPPRRRR